MQKPTVFRRAPLLAAGGLVSALLVVTAPAATAAPVFVDADTEMVPFSGASTSSGACTTSENPSANPEVPVVENGPPVTVTPTVTGSSDDGGGDTATSAAQASVTGSVRSAGGQVSALDLTMTGSASVDTALPTSGCVIQAYAGSDLDFRFLVTQPVVMHLEFKSRGDAYSEVYIFQDSPNPRPYYQHYGRGVDFTGNDMVFLPPGTYDGYFLGEVVLASNVDRSGTASTSAHATFHVAGSQTEAVKGKGKRYVTLPAARSCATDSLVLSVTDKKKWAKKIKQVKFFVDDKLVKKVKKPKKGATVSLPVADDVTADVRAEVKLFPVRKGRPGKVHEVSAAYEACNG